MLKSFKYFSYLTLGWLMLLNPSPCRSQKITYYLEIDEQHWHSFHVRIIVENVNQSRLVFTMPVWRPGVYQRQDFGQFVSSLEAFSESAQSLTVTRLNQQRWSVHVDSASFVRVEYDVNHTSPGLLGVCLDRTFAYVDGAMNLMFIQGKENLPLAINFTVPHGWKLATGLPVGQRSFEFFADDYHHLIDCPVLMSKFSQFYFTVKDHPVYVILKGRQNFDLTNFLRMIKQIVRYQTEFFGEIPFEKYFFLFKISPNENISDGIGHRNSAYIKLTNELELKDIAGIVAQKFFQIWNLNRIYPASFSPFDYTQEPRTKNIWFCEGVTNYYSDLTLIRSKIWSEQEFLQHQAELIKQLQENPDRLETSLEKASLETCERYFHSSEVLYDVKGQLIGLLLDLKIREMTDNTRSLDDLMSFMNWWFAKKGVGYQDEDILWALNAIINYDFSDFFNQYVSGTIELPYEEIFHYAGILIKMDKVEAPNLGLLRIADDQNIIVDIAETGPLAKAGLKKGDLLATISGKAIQNNDDISHIVESLEIGSEVQLVVERDGIQLNLSVMVDKKDKIDVQLDFLPKPNERQLKIRRGWLEDTN